MPAIAPAAALLIAAAALPQLHGSSGAQTASETDLVATGLDAHERMTVPVRIGTSGPHDFVIDTGAQNTVLSTALARRLSLAPSARATLLGVAGSRMVDTVEVEELGIGRRTFNGLIAPLLEREHIGAEGIVGLDSLQGQRVLLDFKRKVMAVDEARQLGGNRGFEIVVTARRRSGQLIMTNARIDGIPVDVVIDTGADTTIGNRALQRAMSRRNRGHAMLQSVTGQQLLADVGVANTLAFAGIQLTKVTLAFADAPPFAHLDLDRKPAILLGMRELRHFNRVAIDFNSRKILFDYEFNGMRTLHYRY
jgi:predicted aspartyl protease